MSKRSSSVSVGGRGTGHQHRRSRRPARPLVATAAAIGGAGLVLAAPGAALMANPAEAQAQPIDLSALTSLFGGSFAIPLTPAGLVGTAGSTFDPILDIATAIPFLNLFVGNGPDGTAASPNGGNAIGLFVGNGGDGFHRPI